MSPVTDAAVAPAPSKVLNIALWLAQLVLALMYGMAGVMKTTQPIAELSKTVPWSKDVPEMLVRFIGACELAGALGLVLPAATRILPILTPLAATALASVMFLATAFHVSRGEFQYLSFTLGLFAAAAFIAWGRYVKAPIAPRR
jgi:putative oxidoreductase